ncbi:MAG: alpha-L-arabinofuranosidase C-terminal domain-containing protein [Candidatus Sulfotelmatobacter sp.]
MQIGRRQFLKCAAASSLTFAYSTPVSWARTTDARIEIMPEDSNGIISSNLFGQFTEHIGGVIYDGVWVGEESKIPNRYGIRAALIDALKKIEVPIIRWPGGCFADSYDWMDGIGPAASRPKRTNFWEVDPDAARLHERGNQVFESNRFGTNEFIRFCGLTGAKPYVAANVRSLPALSFDHWVEYCNSPAGSTALAAIREAAGFPEPFRVRYWGVGNESWGCGGNFTPEEYASELRRYTSWVPHYGVDLQFIGSGPNNNDLDWTHRVFEELYSDHPYRNQSFTGWSIHYYASNLSRGKTKDWVLGKGDALVFDSIDWYELMQVCDKIDQILKDQWAVMGQYDVDHNVHLVVDEYGPWYREGTEVDPTHIFGQQVSIRDALATALTLDTFNRNSDKVTLATNAQLVNNINALFLAHEDHFVATPNYYVFDMYKGHQNGTSLRVDFSSANVEYTRDGERAHFWGLNGSASQKGNVITLTAVNPSLEKPLETQIALRDRTIKSAAGNVLAATDMHAHNSFEHPDAVMVAPLSMTVKDGCAFVAIPKASVITVELTIE